MESNVQQETRGDTAADGEVVGLRRKALNDLIMDGCKALDLEYGSDESIEALDRFCEESLDHFHQATRGEFEAFSLKATDGEMVAWLIQRLVEDELQVL